MHFEWDVTQATCITDNGSVVGRIFLSAEDFSDNKNGAIDQNYIIFFFFSRKIFIRNM